MVVVLCCAEDDGVYPDDSLFTCKNLGDKEGFRVFPSFILKRLNLIKISTGMPRNSVLNDLPTRKRHRC